MSGLTNPLSSLSCSSNHPEEPLMEIGDDEASEEQKEEKDELTGG